MIIIRIFFPQIGTGFKDEDLDAHYKFLSEHVTSGPKSYYAYDSSHEPDHWFEPVQVWEIKAADITISPTHKAGIGLVRNTWMFSSVSSLYL